MTAEKRQQSIFPDLPRASPVVDEKGEFNQLWSLGFASLFQTLQQNYKSEGILFPKLTAAQKQTIQDLYTPYVGGSYTTLTNNLPDISGQTIFDTTNFVSFQFIIVYNGGGTVTSAQWKQFMMV